MLVYQRVIWSSKNHAMSPARRPVGLVHLAPVERHRCWGTRTTSCASVDLWSEKPFDILWMSKIRVFFGLIDCNCMMYIESQFRLTAIIDYVQYNVYAYNIIYIYIYVEVHCCCTLNNIQTLWHDRGWDVDVGGNQVFHPTLQELPSIQLNPSPIEDLLKII